MWQMQRGEGGLVAWRVVPFQHCCCHPHRRCHKQHLLHPPRPYYNHHAPHNRVSPFWYQFLVGWLQNASQAEWCLVLVGTHLVAEMPASTADPGKVASTAATYF